MAKIIDLTPKHFPIIPAKEKIELPMSLKDDVDLVPLLGGSRMGASEIIRGAGDKIFKVGEKGIWLGNAVFGNAPFKVDVNGNLTAQDIAIGALKWLKLTFIPTFESVDGWYKSAVGTGATITPYVGICKLTTGNAVGDQTKIAITPPFGGPDAAKNPYFQATIDFSTSPTYQDVAVGVGSTNPFAPTDFFGFRWSKADAKMYAYYFLNSVETKTEIVGFSTSISNILRAEMSDNGDTIKYYVNGVLKVTHTAAGGPGSGTDVYFCFDNKCQVATYNLEAYIWNVIYSQDL